MASILRSSHVLLYPPIPASQCYEGAHLSLWVPIGAVAVVLLCLAPPIVTFMIMWRIRHALDTPAIMNRFGFLYARYRRKYYFFESILQLQVGCLACVLSRPLVNPMCWWLAAFNRDRHAFLVLATPSKGAEPGGGDSVRPRHFGYQPGAWWQ
jgi:hypothetical protein